MALNKKQQKQLDIARKKLQGLRQQLAGAKKQPDDLTEILTLRREIDRVEAEIAAIKNET